MCLHCVLSLCVSLLFVPLCLYKMYVCMCMCLYKVSVSLQHVCVYVSLRVFNICVFVSLQHVCVYVSPASVGTQKVAALSLYSVQEAFQFQI